MARLCDLQRKGAKVLEAECSEVNLISVQPIAMVLAIHNAI